MNASLTANEIINGIKEKRNEFESLSPLNGRKWYVAVGQDVKQFTNQYPSNVLCEFHYLIQSKNILDEVLTSVLKLDNHALTEIEAFLSNKTVPVYIFNYCFNFK